MEELVKRLWECASGECFNCSQYRPTTNASVCQKELMKQAADAIEELADFLDRWEMGDVDYSKTFCDLCDGFYDCNDDCLLDWLKQEAEP